MNALCRPVSHRAQCSCPDCYAGDATSGAGCAPDPSGCVRSGPGDPTTAATTVKWCAVDADCPASLACAADGACRDPCDGGLVASCDPPKTCVVRGHRARCACAFGFAVSELGELSCAPAARQCRDDGDCAPHERCTGRGQCRDACDGGAACPSGKKCLALDHRPVCACATDCSPAASMCLRDAGCPEHQACVRYGCVDPCANVTCPANAPCAVRAHKAVCEPCPAGYSADSKSGCLKGKCTKNPSP